MSDGIEDYDIVFWLGDLNYRINGNTRSVGYLMRSKLHEVLHANDQLRLQQRKGRVFQVPDRSDLWVLQIVMSTRLVSISTLNPALFHHSLCSTGRTSLRNMHTLHSA